MRFQRILWVLLILGLSSIPVLAQGPADSLKLPDAPNKICPLPIGSTVPQINLRTLTAEPFDLNARLKTKPTILIYFRGGW